MSDTFDLVLAAYPALETAQKDFDTLVALVKDKKVRSDGMILVTRDESGEVHITDTGSHLGRKGMGWGGGVGVLVGLAAPPLLAATAVGAAAGGIVGKFAKHKVDSGLEAGMGDKLKPGTAAIIAMIDAEDRVPAELALSGAPAKSVAPMDKKGVRGLKDALAEAAGKFNPDRTVLPIPDRVFGGAAGHTLDASAADWSFIPGPSAPEDAPNVLIVLIDDAGFGGPDTFGGGIATPEPHPRAADGSHLQPLPRDRRLLPDQGRDAHRTQPPPRRHGRHRRASRALPRLHRHATAQLHRPAARSCARTATSPAASASGT